MKRNKGFTLIELLAVIVILAIIALIATPLILGVIETAKKGASESSALGYIDAVEKQVAINELDSTKIKLNDGVYEISQLLDMKYGITVKGDVPGSGWIYIQDGIVNNYSFVIGDYITTKGEEVKKGNVSDKKPICIKATKLHTEECLQTDLNAYCSGAGYVEGSKGTTITYGTVINEKLKSGDAFDCDVDGDGIYSSENERFYYVTDLEENNNYAVLIYYNNTVLGVSDNSSIGLKSYDVSGENCNGPVTAITNLPTKEQWNKVKLLNSKRAIITEYEKTSTIDGVLPTDFSYEGYAARLLTSKELKSACSIPVLGLYTKGELDNCNYLLENTKYSSNLKGSDYWLETPLEAGYHLVWRVYSSSRNMNNNGASNVMGIRPVIEVLKSDILY